MSISGPQAGPKLGPRRGPKGAQKRPKGELMLRSLLGPNLGPTWGHFGVDFGVVLGSILVSFLTFFLVCFHCVSCVSLVFSMLFHCFLHWFPCVFLCFSIVAHWLSVFSVFFTCAHLLSASTLVKLERASRSLFHSFFSLYVFWTSFLMGVKRPTKIVSLGFLAALGADMADFGAQLGPQKAPKTELFRGPRGNLS